MNKACERCGLVQLHDELWGFVFCDAAPALIYGCPDKELVLERYPSAEYDETKIIEQPLLRPFFYE